MEARQIVTKPVVREEVRTDESRNALRIPAAHWAEVEKRFAANIAIPVGDVCAIAVPKTLYNRRVYCDFKAQNQVTTEQFINGTIEFFLAGNRVLTLPFEYSGRAGDKAYGIRICPSMETSPGGNHLVSWNPTGQPSSGPIYLAPFEGRLACDKVVLVARAGSTDPVQLTTAILACYSEGEIE